MACGTDLVFFEDPRQCDARLALVFPFSVAVGGFARFVPLEEKHLCDPFVGIDFCRKGGGVGDLYRDMPFKPRFKRGDVDDDAASGIGAFAQADGQRVAWHFKILYRPCQCKRVRRYDADIPFEINDVVLMKVFGINDLCIDIGKDLKFIAHADIVSIRAQPVADDSFSYQPFAKRGDHLFVE